MIKKIMIILCMAGSVWLNAQQGIINFYDSSTAGINSIGPHDSNKSIRINGEKNVDVVIDEASQYLDGAFNIFRDGPSVNPLFQVTRNGNVGIGKTASTVKLDVNGSMNGTQYITVSKGGSYRVGMNGQADGYIIGRNDSVENKFQIHSNGFTWFNGGNVGIGTTAPDAKLAVNGNIHAKEVKVDLTGWPDYVFKENYTLPTLEEVEKHIQEKGHLINLPSAKEVEANGVELGEMNKLLLEKIEELTLYTLQQQKQLLEQKEENKKLEDRLSDLEKQISTIITNRK